MRAEFAAFRALLEAVPNLPVFDTVINDEGEEAADRPPIYVVAFDQTPRDTTYALDARRKQSVHTFPLMAVGTSPGEVRWAIEKASDALRRRRLVAGGRTSSPLRKISNSDVRKDPDAVTQPLYSATDVWRCAFDRA